ncbi:mapk-regulated corepressor-interacting protein 1 isoform X2 [Scyliorhinus torazame]|uniref:mapk-regulated corepressor-interacting protein 1 isoform X2 n=1 Tax=Scyliorhinus torazame TaxID=75743 RepID=UPI003B5BFE6B
MSLEVLLLFRNNEPRKLHLSSPAPRIVYNGKRNNGPRSPTNTAPQDIYTPAHEENVRFIHEAWQCVERELRSQMSGNERGPVQYVEKNPNPNLHNFTPVDLSDLKKRGMSDAKKS